jgi:drug/metabolite transporter (DMT)-like permease
MLGELFLGNYLAGFKRRRETHAGTTARNNQAVFGRINFALSTGLSTWGVKYITSGLGAIISALFPIWIIIINFFNGERIARMALFGILISFAGICVIFVDYIADFLRPDFQFGIILMMASTITWAFGIL